MTTLDGETPGNDGPSQGRGFGRAAAHRLGQLLLDPGDRVFWVGLVVVVLSLIGALATFAILTGLTPLPPSGEVVLTTLLLNAVLIVAMFAVLAWQFVGLLKAWREKVPGARLQVRVVALFSLIAVLPAMLLALAATTTFSRSLDGWFSKKTREIIDNSADVARAYIDVHGQLIITDILNMARDVDAEIATEQAGGPPTPARLKTLLQAQTTLRGLPVGHVIDAEGRRLATAFEDDKVSFARPPVDAIRRAEEGQVPLLDSSATSRVYAVAKLAQLPSRYLYVARELPPAVVEQIRRTQQNTDEYQRLRAVTRNLKVAHGLMYFMIASTALLAAIWAGLWFAARFVSPIRRLIEGAELVSKGDLAVVLPERRGEGDLRRFSATFNKMTRELKHQRDALVSVNGQLESRRRFTEAVLSGVSAGVIGLDSQGRVTLVSRSAERLLAIEGDRLVGHTLPQVLPEFVEALDTTVESTGKHRAPRQAIRMVASDERTFAVEVTREQAGDAIVGSVLTFDDVTDLVSAQRTAAWASVARRIAHEIKNPLTPIQLSAERIKRKYGKEITSDRETFDKLTDAISRQVDVIKSMVDEFASFARLPEPSLELSDLREVVHGPAVLFRESHQGINFLVDVPNVAVRTLADRRLLSQAVTNLVKNATEAVEALATSPEKPDGWHGMIEVRLAREPTRAIIEVIDNGIGLPKQNRARLLEPYVTTRAKGTGLGLAIVQKIVEQHRGTLELDDAPPAEGRTRGARFRLAIPLPLELRAEQTSGPPAEPTTAALALPAPGEAGPERRFADRAEPMAAERDVAPSEDVGGGTASASQAGPSDNERADNEPADTAATDADPATTAPTSLPTEAATTLPADRIPDVPRPDQNDAGRPYPPVANLPVANSTLLKNSGRVMPRPESRSKGARP